MSEVKDITGHVSGYLTVEKLDRVENGGSNWWCRCKCAALISIRGDCLKDGNTRSCGCLKKELIIQRLTTHGLTGHPLHDVWTAMKLRCNLESNEFFHNYGGRGVTVCKEWMDSFQVFYDWALNSGYKKGLSIDRIDNNGNYCPENCRWVSHKINNRNKRTNRLITYKGETKIVTVWAEFLNMPPSVLMHRLNQYKWSVEKAIETPYKPKGPYNIKKKKV
jgi:hypothetical protein